MNKSPVEQHESYGMVGLCRASVGPRGVNLFGSSIRHGEIMILRVQTASKRHDLHQDWVHADKEIVELYLSPVQFAQMITTPNVGDGVPCTLRRIQGEPLEECPEVSQRQILAIIYLTPQAQEVYRAKRN